MRTASRFASLALVAASAACASRTTTSGAPGAPAAEAPVASGQDLLRRMHERYAGKWYRSLQFLQKNTLYLASGGTQPSEWMEYQLVPGKLRIDFVPLSQKSGVLFLDSVQHTFNDGKLVDSRPLVHGLLLLSADVYALPVEQTLRLADSLKVDLGVLHEQVVDGRRMYVVGATPGDTTVNQFWVDADSLLLRRLIQAPARQGRRTVTDTRLTYQDAGGFPVPREIVFLRDGRPSFREEYTQVRVNVDLPAHIFDPARYAETQLPLP